MDVPPICLFLPNPFLLSSLSHSSLSLLHAYARCSSPPRPPSHALGAVFLPDVKNRYAAVYPANTAITSCKVGGRGGEEGEGGKERGKRRGWRGWKSTRRNVSRRRGSGKSTNKHMRARDAAPPRGQARHKRIHQIGREQRRKGGRMRE